MSPESAIIEECQALRSSIQSINDKFRGPLEKTSQKNTVLPFVFLLGNHSSGKSSFINYVLQRKVQTAGVAPTDDSFTIIVPGPSDVDRDGPSFIGDPEMGFAGLRTFGPPLVHHTKLKIRSNTAVRNFMVVDSPGMIDSPMVRDSATGVTKYAVMDRGYDFEGVCRWYAERADVILLFFDPDKPGTTGETLSILTNSLVGLDHKLHIILNKADQFRKIHDFARAYGSLCWNLSKVIQRKDLPMIYTMCLPQAYQSHQQQQQVAAGSPAQAAIAAIQRQMGAARTAGGAVGAVGVGGGAGLQSEEGSLGNGLADLETTREEVIKEVLNAPKRRIDNEISRLTDAVSLLQMHVNIIHELSKQYKSAVFRSRLTLGASVTASFGVTGAMVVLGALPGEPAAQLPLAASLLATAVGGNALLLWWQTRTLDKQIDQLATQTAMEAAFQRLYARRIAENDESINSLWIRVKDHLTLTMSSAELAALDSVGTKHTSKLEKILEVEIPNLRRKAAPEFNRNI
eukprot:CAMPEP_0174983848 /NCGR_PEP_ID=MMETSP0004_2-20121128/17382_1 /TAXON_ID=420556 /ORGANISM="Ochromonas sp., Strain CCMP1393" /LENGTH=514 /DNA_ID=CAMNT_0016236167 /DNA_START=214 /DNA_END=1758 /DNA_ORIENTATION=+